MSQATIFHVVVEPILTGIVTAEEFRGGLNGIDAEGVEDRSPDESKDELDKFFNELQAAGFEVDRLNLPVRCAFRIRPMGKQALKDAKMKYFKTPYEVLVDLVTHLSLEAFACGTENCVVGALKLCIDNNAGDRVYLEPATRPWTYTMANFVRNLKPRTEYFVSDSTIYMR